MVFLGVALLYIVFTFAWGWYKGRQEDNKTRIDSQTVTDRTGGEQ